MTFSEWLEIREMMGSVAAIPSCSYCSSPDFQVQGAYCSKCRGRGRRKKNMKNEQNSANLSSYLQQKYGKGKAKPANQIPARANLKVQATSSVKNDSSSQTPVPGANVVYPRQTNISHQ